MQQIFSSPRFGLLISVFLLSSAFNSGDHTRPAEWLGIKDYDFGLLARSRPARHHFAFKNKSFKPLVIDNVRTPCGCTAVEWPDTPILPGDTASIVVEFNAAQSGYFHKTIKVFFQGFRGPDLLSVQGEVE